MCETMSCHRDAPEKPCRSSSSSCHRDSPEKKPFRSSSSRKESKNLELVGFDSLPEYLKDNEFILGHYRADWPMKETILSIFSLHNETLNIWTHLIGFFIFLCITVCAVTVTTAIQWNSTVLQLDEAEPSAAGVPRWPFFAFLIGAMMCLLTSSACHLLSCRSETCSSAMLRLDYAGISTLIVTSFYPLVYYTFLCDPFLCGLYIGSITVFGVATVAVSLLSVFQKPKFRLVRTLLFLFMGVSGLVPIVHKVFVFGDQEAAILTTWYEAGMGALYVSGVAVYITRIPERWMPGKFDLLGHSHQLFHLLVIGGAYTHYLAGLEYLKWRDNMQGHC